MEKTTCTSSVWLARGNSIGIAGAATTVVVTMKMTSSTSIMSTSGVTLIPEMIPFPFPESGEDSGDAIAYTVGPGVRDKYASTRLERTSVPASSEATRRWK